MSEKKKIKYEKPRVVSFSVMENGLGLCSDGSGDIFTCQDGSQAGALCDTGSAPQA